MKKTRKGFTLIELLVVIGIIALIISILLPSLNSARQQSKSVKCLSNATQVGKAMFAFQNDYETMQLVAHESSLQFVDSARSKFAYYRFPNSTFSGALASQSNVELLSWPVAYANFMNYDILKNWKWGARADDLADARSVANAIETDALSVVTCPADKGVNPIGPLGSPGAPNTQALADLAVGGFDPSLSGTPEREVNSAADDPANAYYGALSYAVNLDVFGAEPAVDATSTTQVGPRCFKGSGVLDDVGFLGGVSAQAGRRLAGKADDVFQPSQTILLTDGGADIIAPYGGNERVLTFSSSNLKGEEPGASQWTHAARAHFGSVVESQLFEEWPDYTYQVIPKNRHPGGRVNCLRADGGAEAIAPVSYRDPEDTGDTEAVPREYADLKWVSPYSVGANYSISSDYGD